MAVKSKIVALNKVRCSKRPKVTIGVCVMNCEDTISEAIESIIAQDFPHELMEVIFVDDGSEDKTLQIIEKYAAKMDITVKVFHHSWKGLGYSRNVVVNNARGDYIIWIDGDMIIPKDHVRKQVEYMEQHPKVGIAKAKYGMFPTKNLVATLENIPFVIISLRNYSQNLKLPGTGGSIYRVDAVRQVGGFDDRLAGVGEDLDIAYRILSANWLIKKSPAIFFEKRETNWRDLWKKYTWYGYGNFWVYCQNKAIFKLYKMMPPASLIAGLLHSISAYKLIRRKVVFLLPIHFIFKSIAWTWGFIKACFRKICM